jgi:hypothetical protein
MKAMIAKMTMATFAAAALANCQERPARFTVRVQDDTGKPVPGCEVVGSFFDHWKAGEGFGEDIFKKTRVLAGADGTAMIKCSTTRGDIYYSATAPEGYYRTARAKLAVTGESAGKWQPYDQSVTVILKRKLKPIPMYAKDLRSGLSVPRKGMPCSYDFEVGDWLAPDGKGKTADIVFTVDSKDTSGGDFTSLVKISFPNKGDGLLRFLDKPNQGKDCLKSAHQAPENGYQPVAEYFRNRENGRFATDLNTDANYYLRTRTVLGADGKVISAHYAKVYGEFMYFSYYFNPTANDRNVEFDPERNLFPKTGPNPSPYEP